MTKQQSKMELVTMDQSKEFKKQRMLQMRSLVKQAVKDKERLDLMSFNEADTARVIVALQDQLTAINEKHKKATQHYCAIKHESTQIIEMLIEAIEIQTNAIIRLTQEADIQADRIEAAHNHTIQLTEQLRNARAAIKELR